MFWDEITPADCGVEAAAYGSGGGGGTPALVLVLAPAAAPASPCAMRLCALLRIGVGPGLGGGVSSWVNTGLPDWAEVPPTAAAPTPGPATTTLPRAMLLLLLLLLLPPPGLLGLGDRRCSPTPVSEASTWLLLLPTPPLLPALLSVGGGGTRGGTYPVLSGETCWYGCEESESR
jgi:hypothetical protein